MQISQKTWNQYKNRLAAVDKKAAEEMEACLQRIGGYENHVEEVIKYAYALSSRYGEAAAAAACEMYDAVAEASGVNVPPAEPAATPEYKEVARAVNGTVKNSSEKQIPRTVGRLVKRTGADTTLKNAGRDGAQFAWVPAGDTCAFCLTLASRGWQYMSKNALRNGHAEHIHANCDCQYAIRFDDNTSIEGYDPDKYREMYDNAEGGTPQEKINAMRREQRKDPAVREKLNAQKRAVYAEKHSQINEVAASSLRPKFGAYIPDEKRREGIIQRGIEEERPIFADDLLGALAKEMPPKEGWYDVVMHGWPNHVEFFGEAIDVETLCAIIAQRKDYKKGVPIRLISCYTGSQEDGVAQYVANKLHVDVEAPNKKGIISKGLTGIFDVYSGSEKGKHDGDMIVFHPQESKEIKDGKGTSRVYY